MIVGILVRTFYWMLMTTAPPSDSLSDDENVEMLPQTRETSWGGSCYQTVTYIDFVNLYICQTIMSPAARKAMVLIFVYWTIPSLFKEQLCTFAWVLSLLVGIFITLSKKTSMFTVLEDMHILIDSLEQFLPSVGKHCCTLWLSSCWHH